MPTSSSPEKSPEPTIIEPVPAITISVYDMPASTTSLNEQQLPAGAANELLTWLRANGHTSSETIPIATLTEAIEQSMTSPLPVVPSKHDKKHCKRVCIRHIALFLILCFLTFNFIFSTVMFCMNIYTLALYSFIISVLGFGIPAIVGAAWGTHKYIYMKGKKEGMREYQIQLEGTDREVRECLLRGARDDGMMQEEMV